MDLDYAAQNKEAWDEVFEIHRRGRKGDPADRLLEPEGTFLDAPVLATLKQIGIAGKTVGQLCCNNGRELLSMVKLGARSGVGFDISQNFIREADQIAQQTELDARFVCTDIAEIPAEFNGAFDLVFISAGALCWFQDLAAFFRKAAQMLAAQGILLIHEIHPFLDMVAAKDEPEFDSAHPDRFIYSYFRTEPWVETDGMDYVGGTHYPSKPFYSFTHTLGEITTAVAQNGLAIATLEEYPEDISAGFAHLNGRGLPLSFLLLAKKS